MSWGYLAHSRAAQRDAHDVQAEEVLAKPSGVGPPLEVGPSPPPRASISMVSAPDALEPMFFEEAEQLRLQPGGRRLRRVAPPRAPSSAPACFPCAGEGARTWPKSSLEQMLRERGARDGDERAVTPRAPTVDRRGEDVLRCRSHREQNRGVGWPPASRRERGLHSRVRGLEHDGLFTTRRRVRFSRRSAWTSKTLEQQVELVEAERLHR